MTMDTHEDMLAFGGPPAEPARPLFRSIARGLACRCPNCGRGALFARFGKTVDHCEACGEEIHHHRADDFPAYINMFIVGHVIVGAFIMVERMVVLSAWTHAAIWIPASLLLTLALLQPVKGAVIGIQWAHRMHGFGGEEDTVADPDQDPARHG